jgi:hypothetical protein
MTLNAVAVQARAATAHAAKGGTGVDRGKRTMGLGGEQLKLDADPSSHTAVQRSWKHGGDAALHAVVNVRRVAPIVRSVGECCRCG